MTIDRTLPENLEDLQSRSIGILDMKLGESPGSLEMLGINIGEFLGSLWLVDTLQQKS